MVFTLLFIYMAQIFKDISIHECHSYNNCCAMYKAQAQRLLSMRTLPSQRIALGVVLNFLLNTLYPRSGHLDTQRNKTVCGFVVGATLSYKKSVH